MTNERDTHFAGFAKLLLDELQSGPGYVEVTEPYDDVIKLIAQRAYDLFYHVMEHAQDEVYYPPEQWLGHVPDLTEWPNTSPEAP